MTVSPTDLAAGEPRDRDAGLDEDGRLENDRPDHLRLGGGPAPQRLDPGPGAEQQTGAEHTDREALDHPSIIADPDSGLGHDSGPGPRARSGADESSASAPAALINFAEM